uniref:Uncharacterized protein n=1 Tax=Arundo donax TaxID=35708 RepID=A0A0A9EKW4_ARUDO
MSHSGRGSMTNSWSRPGHCLQPWTSASGSPSYTLCVITSIKLP